jgi:coenzyme PQQ precursor peptide PqqA
MLSHRFRRYPSALAQRGDIGVAGDLLHGLEAMGQAADAAIAVVLRLGGENASRALDPEHATRRNGSRATIGRCRWHRMYWTTPTLVEICIGLEINGYLPAEF